MPIQTLQQPTSTRTPSSSIAASAGPSGTASSKPSTSTSTSTMALQASPSSSSSLASSSPSTSKQSTNGARFLASKADRQLPLSSPSASSSSSKPPPIRRPSSDTESNSEPGTADTSSHGPTSRKAKKKKANRACAACQKAHLTCDDARPCSRCVKKGMGDQCTDGKRKRAKYLLDEDELEAVKAKERAEKEEKDREQQRTGIVKPEEAAGDENHEQVPHYIAGRGGSSSGLDSTVYPPPADPFASTDEQRQQSQSQPPPQNTFFGLPSAPAPDLFAQPPFATAPTAPSDLPSSAVHPNNTPPYSFGSESASLEYSILSAMLNGIDPHLLTGSPDDHDAFASAAGGAVSGHSANNGSGVTPSMELSSFLNPSVGSGNAAPTGTTLPSVGMASDFTSPWLTGPLQATPATATTDPSSNNAANYTTPGWNTNTPAAFGNVAGLTNGSTSNSTRSQIGQLHAIGGEDGSNSAGGSGEVGSGGFRALEVPSPSPSIVSARLGGGRAGSTPPSSTNADHSMQKAGVPPHYAHAPPPPSAFEAHWRDRVNHIYSDLTRPFPYTEGYHFLLKYVTENFQKSDVLRIVRALGLFRPSLIALQMPLTEEDEVFVERSIQRTILEFEKLISFSGTPTVVWRRTCEICVVGSEFSMLTGWTREGLLGRRIYEYWDKASTLEYWEKFASHAFENTSQSIVANVVLKRPDGTSVPCAACFSIKRNVFDLPSLVVGAFLPILSSL